MSKKKDLKRKASVAPKPGETPYRNYFIAAAIAVTTLVTFLPTLKNEFTNWDDDVYVNNNPLVATKHIPYGEIWRTPVSLNYHPLTIITLAWNFHAAGLNPHAYFLTNVWLHVFNTLLVFIFIYLLCDKRWIPAAITSLWFGIHPMHVESVSWVAERKDVLYTFFFLLLCICYLRFLQGKNWFWYSLCFLLFLASALSKAMAVVLPVILLLIDYFRGRKLELKVMLEKVPFFVVSLILGVVAYRIQAEGAIAEMAVFEIDQRIIYACYGLVMYVVKLFGAGELSAFYPYPTYDAHQNLSWFYYLLPLIPIAVVAIVYFKFRKEKFLIFGLLFYFTCVVLVLQFISVGSVIMADRYSYVSYIGLFFIIGIVADRIFSKTHYQSKVTPVKLITIGLLAAYSILFITQTRLRIPVWKNSESLWTDVINKYPMRVEVAYKNRGSYYGQHNRIDDAYQDYMMLMKMNSKDSKVYSNLGNIYGLQKKFPESISTYTKAISIDSTNLDAYINRGITYGMMSEYQKSLADFNRAAQLRPNAPEVYGNRAMTFYNMGLFENAVSDFTHKLQLKGDDPSSFYYRGLANYRLNKTEEAKRDLMQAQQLNFNGDFSLLKKL